VLLREIRTNRMKEFITSLILIIIIVLFTTSSAFAGWLIYHKPEFRGKVIDADTKEPIENAVVVIVYKTHPIISGPAGGSASIITIKETLTDKIGEFYFPSYTTIIQPLAEEWHSEFIIYKPGYGSYPGRNDIYPLNYVGPEYTFSKKLGTKEKIRKDAEIVTITHSVVELPKLKTQDEWLTSPSIPADVGSKEAPILYKMLNEVRKKHGLGEVR
jgi:hypothetical protein